MAAVTQLSRASSDVSLWSNLAGPNARRNSVSSSSQSTLSAVSIGSCLNLYNPASWMAIFS